MLARIDTLQRDQDALRTEFEAQKTEFAAQKTEFEAQKAEIDVLRTALYANQRRRYTLFRANTLADFIRKVNEKKGSGRKTSTSGASLGLLFQHPRDFKEQRH